MTIKEGEIQLNNIGADLDAVEVTNSRGHQVLREGMFPGDPENFGDRQRQNHRAALERQRLKQELAAVPAPETRQEAAKAVTVPLSQGRGLLTATEPTSDSLQKALSPDPTQQGSNVLGQQRQIEYLAKAQEQRQRDDEEAILLMAFMSRRT